MSRTDKDMPWWVRAEWYEPFHRCGWIRRPKYRLVDRVTNWGLKYTELERVGWRWEYRGDCDLPAEPTRNGGRKWWLRSGVTRCFWEAEWPHDYNYMSRGKRKKALRRTEFHGPQRTAERVAARRAIQGDWEAEFPDGRGRNSVLWDLW